MKMLPEAYSEDRFTQFSTVCPRYTLTTGTTVDSSIGLYFIHVEKERYLSLQYLQLLKHILCKLELIHYIVTLSKWIVIHGNRLCDCGIRVPRYLVCCWGHKQTLSHKKAFFLFVTFLLHFSCFNFECYQLYLLFKQV